MKYELSRYENYPEARTLDELNRPGNRFHALPGGLVSAARGSDHAIAAGAPAFRHEMPAPSRRPCGVARLENAVKLPKRLVLTDVGKVAVGSFRRPHLTPESVDLAIPEELPRVRGVGYCIDTEYTGHGHLLVECLSQLWAIRHLDFDYVFGNKKIEGYFGIMLAPFTDKPVKSFREPVRCQTLLLPGQSFVLSEFISTAYLETCRAIRDHYAPPTKGAGDRIYVSRRFAPSRSLRNEEEVEALFARHGFEIVHVENVPLAEQIGIFARASVVAGPVGSALYNVVFSRLGTKRLILAPHSFYTPNDLLLTAFTEVPPVYVFGEGSSPVRREAMTADWFLPLASARAGLAAL